MARTRNIIPDFAKPGLEMNVETITVKKIAKKTMDKIMKVIRYMDI